MNKLFLRAAYQHHRQVEFDLAKCLSIVFMIFLHCLMVASGFSNDISVSMQRLVGQLLGGPYAAPVFMFFMGTGIVYSRNHSPAYLMKRGIKLMLLGVVVNIGEFILPHFLAGYLLGEWDIFPIAGGLLLFCVDILAFAGLAMIAFGLAVRLHLSAAQILAVSFVLSVAGSFLRFSDLGSDIGNLIAGYFIGSAGGFTAFPFFNWILLPSAGVFFGEYYIRCDDKKKLLSLWPAGLAISAAYFIASWFIPGGFLSEVHHYYFMTTIDAVFCLLSVYGEIGFCCFLSGYLSDRTKHFLSKTSGNVNEIYIVQWFLIPVTFILICFFNREIRFGDLSLVIIALAEIIAAAAAADAIKRMKRQRKKRRENQEHGRKE
jgi:surface polysaccharide O-acyltransferase-like enzyme